MNPFWPYSGAGVIGGLVLFVALALLVGAVPAGWVLIRRRYGRRAAGPLWPLLMFEVFACLYAFVTPPWQMPDEPQHMVYVELIRRAGSGLPRELAAGDAIGPNHHATVIDVRRTIVGSLKRWEIERWNPASRPTVDAGHVPGPEELNHPQLYYRVAAEVTRPLASLPVTSRLAVLRAFGILLSACVVWLCGAAGRMLWRNRFVAEAPAALAAGIPTFAVFGAAVNNDVLAILMGGLLLVVLLAAVRRRGVPTVTAWGPLLVAAAVIAAGVATKRTFLPMLAAAAVVLLARIRWTPRKMLLTGALVQGFVAVLVLSAPEPVAALWLQPPVSGGRCSQAHTGQAAFCFRRPERQGVSQILPEAHAERTAGRDVVVSFWARAERRPQAVVVRLLSNRAVDVGRAALGPEWQRSVVTLRSPARTTHLKIQFWAERAGDVVLDDVSLSTEDHPDHNLIANGSAELSAARSPDWLPAPLRRGHESLVTATTRIVGQPGAVIASIGGSLGQAWQTFGMFWATVGWNLDVPLLPRPLLAALVVLVGAAVVGLARAVSRRPSSPGRRRAMLVAAVATAAFGLAALLRDLPPTEGIVVSGRYVFPGLVAFTVLLVAGWRNLWPGDDRSFRHAVRLFAVGMHGTFILLLYLPFVLG